MVTSSKEYWQLLYTFQNKEREFADRPVPSDEPIYDVDLDARTIEAPKYLGVVNDTQAECIYFRCPRYFDSMDLTLTTCLIIYQNAGGDERLYPVPFYDNITEAEEGNILIPWIIREDVTRYPGPIKFAIRFYSIDADNLEFIYSLNTLPAVSEVQDTITVTDTTPYTYAADFIDQVLARLARVEQEYNLYWLETK